MCSFSLVNFIFFFHLLCIFIFCIYVCLLIFYLNCKNSPLDMTWVDCNCSSNELSLSNIYGTFNELISFDFNSYINICHECETYYEDVDAFFYDDDAFDIKFYDDDDDTYVNKVDEYYFSTYKFNVDSDFYGDVTKYNAHYIYDDPDYIKDDINKNNLLGLELDVELCFNNEGESLLVHLLYNKFSMASECTRVNECRDVFIFLIDTMSNLDLTQNLEELFLDIEKTQIFSNYIKFIGLENYNEIRRYLEVVNFKEYYYSLDDFIFCQGQAEYGMFTHFDTLFDDLFLMPLFAFDVFSLEYLSFKYLSLKYLLSALSLTFDINYIFFSFNFNFLGFIFILLTFIVFFIVWFYGFCVGITRTEVITYVFIEFLSFSLFLMDNLLFFVVILELVTVMLLFIYTGDRYRRFRAMSLLFYYTIASGLFLLLVFLVRETGIFLGPIESLCLFFLMLIGVFIKLPIYPFHLWLPEAHAEATTCGSLILAGVILKMGFYGFVHFVSFEIFYFSYKNIIISFLLFSSFFLLCAIYVQVDIKKIIAYSSVIHMQIALAVFLMDSLYAYESAILIVINHGLISVGLFVIASLYITNEGTRDIIKWNFSSNYLSRVFLCFILSNMSFPFTIGFWGELFAVYSALNMSMIILILFLLNQIIVVIYNLRVYWLVLSCIGPYYRLRGFINHKVIIVLFIILFYNFFLFTSIFCFIN